MKTKFNPMTQVWPNTATGAIDALVHMSVFKRNQISDKGADVYPDPLTCGVWMVTLKNGIRNIVYLAGHGNNRFNDFESEM
jgi:hypothetical protein